MFSYQICQHFFQFFIETNRKIKDQYLSHDLMKSHAVQFKALKEMKYNKEVTALSKLTVSTDVLSWMDRSEKYLLKVPGVDYSP